MPVNKDKSDYLPVCFVWYIYFSIANLFTRNE